MLKVSNLIELLQASLKTGVEPVLAVVNGPTIGGSGYNLKDTSSQDRYYLHSAGSGIKLSSGKQVALTFAASTRAPGRLDVEVFTELDSVSKAVELLLNDTENRGLLSDKFCQSSYFGKHVSAIAEQLAPSDPEAYLSFFETLPPYLRNKLAKTARVELVPYLLHYEIGELQLEDFIDQRYQTASEDQLERVYRYASKHNFLNLVALLNLVSPFTQNSASIEDIDRLLRFRFKNRTSELIDLLIEKQRRSSNWLENLVLYCNHPAIGGEIRDRIRKEIPTERSDFRIYLEQVHPEFQKWIVNNLPLGDLRLLDCLDYEVSEKTICSFLAAQESALTHDDLRLLQTCCKARSFHQANFAIQLVLDCLDGTPVNMGTLNQRIDTLSKQLFNYHSPTLSKIESLIFQTCDVSQHTYGPGGLTLCEGKIWHPRAGSPEELPETKALCRRKNCDACALLPAAKPIHGERAQPNSLLYKICENYLGITPAQLHSNEQFVREIAALNRWNEICSRLHCEDCETPLALSEHANNSIGKMVYGATYWHCANKQCLSYCRSVKLTHCIGCHQIIDTRVNEHSCTPTEIKSYKKFYICRHCASCCVSHHKISGRCPACGIQNAYREVEVNNRTQAACRECGHKVSIDKFGFEQIEAKRQRFREKTPADLGKSPLIVPMAAFGENNAGLLVHDWSWDRPEAYVWDLYFCLANGLVSQAQLDEYDTVHDLKVLWRLSTLGLNHAKYGDVKLPVPEITEIINPNTDGKIPVSDAVAAAKWLNILFSQIDKDDLWDHYNGVELPFIKSLKSLVQGGMVVSQVDLEAVAKGAELSRNILVEALRRKGINSPTESAFIEYVRNSFSGADVDLVVESITRSDFDFVDKNDKFLLNISGINRIERIASLVSAIAGSGGLVRPEYQIIGADTGRCTARSPNLLGFPKELRPLLKARPGWGIVECDYSQMEIGVLAALSNDSCLLEDYNSGDVYERFAGHLGKSRDEAKVVFLSIIYGVGSGTLSRWLSCSIAESENLIKALHERYTEILPYQQSVLNESLELGYAQTITGMKRYINREVSKDPATKHWETNWIKNFPIQANASVIFKAAVTDVAANTWDSEFKLVAPVYDAIVFEAKSEYLEQCSETVVASMKRAMKNAFSQLEPKVSVNNHDTSCWNAGPGRRSLETWFEEIRSTAY